MPVDHIIILGLFLLVLPIICRLTVLVISIILGVPSSLGNGLWKAIKPLGMDILSFFDFISNSIMMPIVSILTCVFIGYIIKPKSIIEEAEAAGGFKSKGCTLLCFLGNGYEEQHK